MHMKYCLITALAMLSCIAQAEIKIGYIYVGPKSDYGYNFAQDQGRTYVEQTIKGAKTTYFENVPENAEVERVMERMVKSGYNIIIPTSYGYLDPALKIAEKYPKVAFLHCGGFKTSKNLGTYFAEIDDAVYLAGIAAGAATKSGKLGYIAAHPIPQVLRNINAFTRGAQTVNPNATTNVVWTGIWSDPAKEAEAANALVDLGVDVLSMHVDSPITIAQTAEKRGVYVVGYHADASKFAPKGWLVGSAWNWGPMMTRLISSIEAKTWKPSNVRGNMAAGDAKLTSFGKTVTPATKALIAKKEAGFKAGTDKLWAGPIVKQDGTQLVAANSALTQAQIEQMDFMVKGVIGTIK